MPLLTTAATAAIAGLTVKELLEDAQESLDQTIQNTITDASNLTRDLIAQIQTSIDALRKQLKSDIDEIIINLQEEIRFQLYNLKISAESILQKAAEHAGEITERVNQDIRATLSKTWLMSEIYALDDIKNTLIPSSVEGGWTISASGLNLGFDSEDIESIVKMKVFLPNSQTFEVLGAEMSAHDVSFALPKEVIQDFRKERTIVLIKAELLITIKKDGFLFFNKKYTGEQPFTITLAPKISGCIQTSVVTPSFDWVQSKEHDKVFSFGLPSGHGSSPSKVTHHFRDHYGHLTPSSIPPKQNDIRFQSVKYDGCSGGGGCGFVKIHKTELRNNGSQAFMHTENWSHGVTVKMRGLVEKYTKINETTLDLPVIEYRDNETIDVKIPKGFNIVLIKGRDRDAGNIDLVIERNVDMDVYPMPIGEFGGITYKGNYSKGNDVIYQFIRYPKL